MAGQTWRRLAPIMLAGVLAAAASYALRPADERPQPDTELDRIEFVLKDARYQILLPRRSRLAENNAPGCVKIWHPRAVRTMTFLEICSASGPAIVTFAKQTTLTDGLRVRYNIDHDLGGGSGGTEGEIKGELDLHGKVFRLTCRDQDETRINPEWCLHYLPYLVAKGPK
jgi:hypothetical protein